MRTELHRLVIEATGGTREEAEKMVARLISWREGGSQRESLFLRRSIDGEILATAALDWEEE
jgi:hypothetical protein